MNYHPENDISPEEQAMWEQRAEDLGYFNKRSPMNKIDLLTAYLIAQQHGITTIRQVVAINSLDADPELSISTLKDILTCPQHQTAANVMGSMIAKGLIEYRIPNNNHKRARPLQGHRFNITKLGQAYLDRVNRIVVKENGGN